VRPPPLAARLRQRDSVALAERVARRGGEVRVAGLAAEMSYYALISLLPLTVGLGASLGFLRALVGERQAAEVENTIVAGVGQVFSPEVMETVAEPLVRGLLQQEYAGAAVIGLLGTFLFASAVFRAVIRALDDAYQVPERRRGLHLWGLAYALAMGSVVVITLVLSLFVVGPLLGGGARVAAWLGLGGVFEVLWAVARWLLVPAVSTAFLTWLYTVAPNARNTWRGSLPGAAGATVALLLIAVGLQAYFHLIGPRMMASGDATQAVALAWQAIGAVLVGTLWIWLSSIAVLTGGILNAELRRAATGGTPPPVGPIQVTAAS
jgi:membrane protein